MAYSTTYSYSSLFMRMLAAARRLKPARAAVLGIHFERWCRGRDFGKKQGFPVRVSAQRSIAISRSTRRVLNPRSTGIITGGMDSPIFLSGSSPE